MQPAVQVIRNLKPHRVITGPIVQVQHITKVQAVEVPHEVTGHLQLQAQVVQEVLQRTAEAVHEAAVLPTQEVPGFPEARVAPVVQEVQVAEAVEVVQDLQVEVRHLPAAGSLCYPSLV